MLNQYYKQEYNIMPEIATQTSSTFKDYDELIKRDEEAMELCIAQNERFMNQIEELEKEYQQKRDVLQKQIDELKDKYCPEHKLNVGDRFMWNEGFQPYRFVRIVGMTKLGYQVDILEPYVEEKEIQDGMTELFMPTNDRHKAWNMVEKKVNVRIKKMENKYKYDPLPKYRFWDGLRPTEPTTECEVVKWTQEDFDSIPIGDYGITNRKKLLNVECYLATKWIDMN